MAGSVEVEGDSLNSPPPEEEAAAMAEVEESEADSLPGFGLDEGVATAEEVAAVRGVGEDAWIAVSVLQITGRNAPRSRRRGMG